MKIDGVHIYQRRPLRELQAAARRRAGDIARAPASKRGAILDELVRRIWVNAQHHARLERDAELVEHLELELDAVLRRLGVWPG